MSSTSNIRVPVMPPGVETRNIIRRCIEGKKDKYNILTFPTHERYETGLCKTGHNFYAFHSEGLKTWNEDYAPVPSNYYRFPENSIFNGISFDFILAQSKFGQFQTAKLLQERLGIPLVSLEHTLPTSVLQQEWLDEIKTMSGDIDVFISDYSMHEWKLQGTNQKVVHHGVDSSLFKPNDLEKKPYVLSVVNDYKNRDYCCNYSGWERITEGIESKIVGTSTDGSSEPAPSLEALIDEYNSAMVFLNTSTVSPVPTSLLEAMSCGCAVVTTSTCMIPEIVRHEENGLISNDEGELKEYINRLMQDEELRKRLGEAARKTIVEDFSEEKFINSWNKIFDYAYGVNK